MGSVVTLHPDVSLGNDNVFGRCQALGVNADRVSRQADYAFAHGYVALSRLQECDEISAIEARRAHSVRDALRQNEVGRSIESWEHGRAMRLVRRYQQKLLTGKFEGLLSEAL